MNMMPEKFKVIAELSDAERREKSHVRQQECGNRLYAAIRNLNDADLKNLSGWVLFGRDYSPEDGDPFEVLERYIREAVIYPSTSEIGYLAGKPIGKYLREAEGHLAGTTSEDIERAQNPEQFGENYQEDYE